LSLDPYTVLGVARTASDDEIKKTYRNKAKALHPDQHPDDEKKNAEFKRVSAAYEVLGDKKKRGQFDRGEIDGDGEPARFRWRRTGGRWTRWQSVSGRGRAW